MLSGAASMGLRSWALQFGLYSLGSAILMTHSSDATEPFCDALPEGGVGQGGCRLTHDALQPGALAEYPDEQSCSHPLKAGHGEGGRSSRMGGCVCDVSTARPQDEVYFVL
jgi:hypothetical protein